MRRLMAAAWLLTVSRNVVTVSRRASTPSTSSVGTSITVGGRYPRSPEQPAEAGPIGRHGERPVTGIGDTLPRFAKDESDRGVCVSGDSDDEVWAEPEEIFAAVAAIRGIPRPSLT